MDVRTEILNRAQQIIDKCGWMVQAVALHPGQPDNVFAYTAALTDSGLPELIMVGLDIKLMQNLLNNAARNSLSHEITAGDEITGIATVTFRTETVANRAAVVARALYGHDRVRLLQLVWPDKHGAYPGEPGWSLSTAQDIPQKG
jgi:hypothetical protein